MLPMRDAKYCNLKLFLIYLVIYGHWIEPQIEHSALLMQVYRFIYSFHMPLFAFLSGLFLRDEGDCMRQCKRSLQIFLPLQAICVVLGLTSFLTPYWHLWYLLSNATWYVMAYLWLRFRKHGIKFLILLMLLGCIAGYVPFIGRAFSASRTLVFAPYFWAGLLLRPRRTWSRWFGALGFFLALVVLCVLPISAEFFYQAEPYGDIAYGFGNRLICYLVGGGLCLFFLAYSPCRRFGISKLGADTMPAYLLHAPLVLWCRELPFPQWMGPIVCAVLLCLICKLLQWRKLYGIYEGGGA